MQSSQSSNPKLWVSNQDGSIRFDASVIVRFLEQDEMTISSGALAQELEDAYHGLAELMATDDGYLPIPKTAKLPILRGLQALKALVNTTHVTDGKG